MCFINSRKGRSPGAPVHLLLRVLSIFQPHSEENRIRPAQLAKKLNKQQQKLHFLAGEAMVVNKAFGPREYKTSALMSRKRVSTKHYVCTVHTLTAERRSI